MIEAAYGQALMDAIDRAATSAWRFGVTDFDCEVTRDELAAMMQAPCEERLIFERGEHPRLYVSMGVVRLSTVLAMKPCGRFVVTPRRGGTP